MNPEQVQDLISWINSQLNYFNQVINESHKSKNFGREAQFEGKRDAYLELLRKLKTQINIPVQA